MSFPLNNKNLQPYHMKTRWGSPVDRRPSTGEAQPIDKIHPLSKMAVTLEPVICYLNALQDLESPKNV